MAEIVLSTLNARYIHTAFGLRYLQANLGPLGARCRILEFTINQPTEQISERILAEAPKILGLGVYIWNATQTLALVKKLKSENPKLRIILGGPEVSHETEGQELVTLADHVIRGEADVLFRQCCERILSGDRALEPAKIIDGPLPDLSALALPYALYTDEDLKNRVIYVEASRGCAFKCEYCLSSLDTKVRSFNLEAFLAEMDQLIQRGARQFKFVDRTFNLSLRVSIAILEFFYSRIELGLFLHFEMIPDRLPIELRQWIQKFPAGSLQFEVGIQTWNEETSRLVSRRQDPSKVEENLKFLRNETGVHIHADLIAGLPAEDWKSFEQGFNRLAALRPHELQLGILKRLRGTPIVRHDQEWAMRYSPTPPYEIVDTKTLNATELAELKRMAKVWDLVSNRGYFMRSLALLEGEPPFQWLRELTESVWKKCSRTHSIDLLLLAELLYQYLSEVRLKSPETVARALLEDLKIPSVRPAPAFLKPYLYARAKPALNESPRRSAAPKRQQRFL